MEISLVSSDGVAQDSILSIRAGATKRQAPVNSGKAFRFPKLAMEDNPLRVALLQQVGSAFLVLKPSDGQYRVFFDSGASCEVAVQQVEGPAGEVPQGASSPEKRESAAQAAEAKDYLERHKVLQFVQAVLQALIKERPEDPYAYMARHFTSGYTQTPPPSREQAQARKTEPAPQQGQAAAPREAAGKAPDPEALKRSLQSSLARACRDGSLSKSLEGLARRQPEAAEAPDSGQEALRKNLQSTLLEACESGALSASLARLPSRRAAAGQWPASKGGGRPAVAAAAAGGEPEEIRLKARDMLVQATKDGSLDSAIGSVLKEVSEESRLGQGKQAKEEDEGEVERIREKMQGMLVSASQDGSLVEAVKAEAHAERVEQSRMLLQGTLLQAIQEGTLESALGQAKAGQGQS